MTDELMKSGSRRRSVGGESQTIKELINVVTGTPVPCLIFVLYWVWINVGYQSTAFFPGSIAVGFPVPAWALSSGVSFVAYLVLALGYRTFERALGSKRGSALASAIIFVGVLLECLCAFGVVDGAAFVVMRILGGALVGLGTPLLLMNIARIFSWQTPRTVLFQTIMGAMGAALVCVVLSFLSFEQFCVVLCALPPLLCFSMLFVLRKKPASLPDVPDAWPKFPTKLFVTAVIHGMALGALFSLTTVSGVVTGSLLVLAAAVLLAAILLAVLALAFRLDYNSLMYRTAFVIIVTGALCVIVIPSGAQVGAFIQLLGFCFLHLLMWGLNCFLVRSFHIPIVWLVGLTTGGCMAGELLMGFVTRILELTMGEELAAGLAEGTLVLAVMVVSLLLSDARNLKDGWSLAKPSNFKPAFSDFRAVLEHVADQYELSPRERDVFVLFARGYNRKAIADSLIVSEETVKSHVKSIYRKCDVHSQQEVIQLAEEALEE